MVSGAAQGAGEMYAMCPWTFLCQAPRQAPFVERWLQLVDLLSVLRFQGWWGSHRKGRALLAWAVKSKRRPFLQRAICSDAWCVTHECWLRVFKAHTESGKESVSMEFWSHGHYIHHCEQNGKDAGDGHHCRSDERPFL